MITLTRKFSSFFIPAAVIAAVVVGFFFPVGAIGLYVSSFLVLMGFHDYRRGAAVRRVACEINGVARCPLCLAA